MDEWERTQFARMLRDEATPEERALWRVLSPCRPKFTRQLPIGPYFGDFACRRARVVVELDGSQHADSERDQKRTEALEADGWQVIRFWNNEVSGNLEGVLTIIAEAVQVRLPKGESFEPQPSRAGRERPPRTRKKGPPPAPPANAGGE